MSLALPITLTFNKRQVGDVLKKSTQVDTLRRDGVTVALWVPNGSVVTVSFPNTRPATVGMEELEGGEGVGRGEHRVLGTPFPQLHRSLTAQETLAAFATRERLGQGFPGSGESVWPGVSSSTGSDCRQSGISAARRILPDRGSGRETSPVGLQDLLPV